LRPVRPARALFERQAVDLIILDWMLPGVNGLDFVRGLGYVFTP
jgi:DNA-binding response OmpR family regulator